MIHVIATVTVKPCTRDEFLRIFKANVPAVLAEEGCISYEPTTDSGFLGVDRPEVVIVVEQWESLAHLEAHLETPHMATFREKVEDIVEDVVLEVMNPA